MNQLQLTLRHDRHQSDYPFYSHLVCVVLSREMRPHSGHFPIVTLCLCVIMCGATLSNSSYLKIPVYWKSVNTSQIDSIPNRRLHDYLSLFPAYGDTSKLGCPFLTLLHIQLFLLSRIHWYSASETNGHSGHGEQYSCISVHRARLWFLVHP